MSGFRISLSRPAIAAIGSVCGARGRRQGCSRQSGRDKKYFLVPDEQYQAREGSHIITDEAEWVDHA